MIVKLHTDGKGYWSAKKKAVKITEIEVSKNELRVYFDQSSWCVNDDGLIYTDRLFLKELIDYLKSHGPHVKVDYSEQGMQGDNFVSFDIYE